MSLDLQKEFREAQKRAAAHLECFVAPFEKLNEVYNGIVQARIPIAAGGGRSLAIDTNGQCDIFDPTEALQHGKIGPSGVISLGMGQHFFQFLEKEPGGGVSLYLTKHPGPRFVRQSIRAGEDKDEILYQFDMKSEKDIEKLQKTLIVLTALNVVPLILEQIPLILGKVDPVDPRNPRRPSGPGGGF